MRELCSLLSLFGALVGVSEPLLGQAPHLPAAPPPIADNSFLLEEAYNQERGVVQHISAFQRSLKTGAWAYTFTQEWPLFSQTSQISFTLPVEGAAARTGVGDIALNYRYQLLGGEGAVAAAPRVSALVPTGDEARGFGSGGVGLQVNMPASIALAPTFVTHLNAGVTVTPRASSPAGRARTTDFALGGSLIWLARPTFNVVLEVAWVRAQAVTGTDRTVAGEAFVVNPGVRWAHNFASGLQIVPGIAFPIGIGPSRGETAALLYLSFEHPLRRMAR
jgi:outer membrane putative beta-barrel porin/alpha-amylase